MLALVSTQLCLKWGKMSFPKWNPVPCSSRSGMCTRLCRRVRGRVLSTQVAEHLSPPRGRGGSLLPDQNSTVHGRSGRCRPWADGLVSCVFLGTRRSICRGKGSWL